LWGRPGFTVLPFFRAAYATWVYARAPSEFAKDAARAACATAITENNLAGAAIMLAAAATAPVALNNIAEFASRAMLSAAEAEPSLAGASVEELTTVGGGQYPRARAAVALQIASAPLWPDTTPDRIVTAWIE